MTLELKNRNSKFLNCFWDLASDNDEKRIQGGIDIIEYVLNAEKIWRETGLHDVKKSNSSNGDNELDSDDDDDDDSNDGEKKDILANDTEYALKRLVRGLGSSRESARQGFSACLCEVLNILPQVRVIDVLSVLDENTKVSFYLYDCLFFLSFVFINIFSMIIIFL
jgi:DNA polymerase phi